MLKELAARQTKKMTSNLALDNTQAKQVYELNLEQAKARIANRAIRKKTKRGRTNSYK